jgi:hypothetical protein
VRGSRHLRCCAVPPDSAPATLPAVRGPWSSGPPAAPAARAAPAGTTANSDASTFPASSYASILQCATPPKDTQRYHRCDCGSPPRCDLVSYFCFFCVRPGSLRGSADSFSIASQTKIRSSAPAPRATLVLANRRPCQPAIARPNEAAAATAHQTQTARGAARVVLVHIQCVKPHGMAECTRTRPTCTPPAPPGATPRPGPACTA